MNASLPRRLSWIAVIAIFGTGLSSTSEADILLSTGYEAPPFIAGQTVNGKGGFTTPPGTNPLAFVVTTSQPKTGLQALESIGGQLTGIPGFVFGISRVAINYDASVGGQPRVFISSQVRLDGPNTNTGNGTSDILANSNLEVTLTDSAYFALEVASNGQAYAYTTDYQLSVPVSLNTYHDLLIELDFAYKVSTFSVDGVTLGTIPFDPGITSSTIEFVQNSMYVLSSATSPANYTGRFDDLLVTTAVPEPVSMTLFAVGSAGLGLWSLRRRSLAKSAG